MPIDQALVYLLKKRLL